MKITKNTPDQLILETRPKSPFQLETFIVFAPLLLMLLWSEAAPNLQLVADWWVFFSVWGIYGLAVIFILVRHHLGYGKREELTLDRYVPTATLRLGRGGRRNTVFSIPLTGEQHARVETYQSKDKPRLTARAHRIAFVHDSQAGSDTFALPVLYRKGNPPREIVDALNAWLGLTPPRPRFKRAATSGSYDLPVPSLSGSPSVSASRPRGRLSF